MINFYFVSKQSPLIFRQYLFKVHLIQCSRNRALLLKWLMDKVCESYIFCIYAEQSRPVNEIKKKAGTYDSRNVVNMALKLITTVRAMQIL